MWIVCPQCKDFFNVERLFWEEKAFAKLKLHCPFCNLDFAKEESPKTWGLDQGGEQP